MQSRFIDDAIDNDRDVEALHMVCEARADVSWYRIPGSAWTEGAARARIDEAKAWYDGYCIHLNFEEFALDPADAGDRKIGNELDPLVAEYVARVARIPRARHATERQLNDVQSTLLSIHAQLTRKVGRNRLVVIFLDEWFVHVGATPNPTHWRTWRISANEGSRRLVGIDRYDTASPHIVTHELLHALRKAGPNKNRAEIRAFVVANNVTNLNERVWQEHYSGANQDQAMSFTTRRNAFEPFAKQRSDVFTVREYLTLLRAGYVKTAPGCECEKRRIRDRERERR